MKSLFPKRLVLALLCCLLLTSCKGGGGSMTAGGGIDGTGFMSAGVVSAFGSIVVNGTDFDTSKAAIIINGEEVGVGDDVVQDNLEIGMVVTVEGRIKEDESAVADRVIYSSNVAGPVESVSGIDPDTQEISLEVLGQTVVINLITLFKGTSYDTIDVGDVVEVSGYRDFDGKIRATYIEDITDLNITVYGVTGFVESLDDPTPNTFMINGLTVDYSLIHPDDLPDNFNKDLFVEVEGELDDTSGELIATAIELADELGGDEVEEFEIMGYVTEIISENDIIKFKIGNHEVHADLNPEIVEYVDGLPSDIALGQKLEAEGDFEGGILTAWEIEFWKPDQIEVEGVVDEVVFVGGFPEFTFEEREDQWFVTSEDIDTEFEDIEKEDIEPGIELEVKGVPQDFEQTVVEANKVSFELE